MANKRFKVYLQDPATGENLASDAPNTMDVVVRRRYELDRPNQLIIETEPLVDWLKRHDLTAVPTGHGPKPPGVVDIPIAP